MTLSAPVATETTNQDVRTDFSLTVLGSGSSGNCSLLTHGDTHVLIDAGFSGKEIQSRMSEMGFDPKQLDAILVTHEHSDHIRSVHTLSRRFEAPIYTTEGTFSAVIAGKKFYDWQEILAGRSFKIGEMDFHPISLPHDAEDPVGFRVECGDKKLAHLTDFGYASGLIRESIKGCDALLVEANHDLDMLKDGPYPWYLKQRIAGRLGHLSNEHFFEMMEDLLCEDVQHVIIAHMSQTNNDPRLVTLQMKRTLRRLGLKTPFGIAQQDTPYQTINI